MLVLLGGTVPPLIGLVPLAVVALRGDIAGTAAMGVTDDLVAEIGSGAVDPAALYPFWGVAREWSIVAAVVLACGWWAVCAVTAARVAAQITALRS
ncbi:hypothetical protein GCM10028858_04150 [Halorubrum pallidum]